MIGAIARKLFGSSNDRRIKSYQPGVDEIRLPGERAFRSRERACREGIEIDRVVYKALAAL